MGMKIILDFDDVIFNTRKFNSDYRRAFCAQGIPEDVFDECYHQLSIRGRSGKKPYDPQKHLGEIKLRLPIDEKSVRRAIDAFLRGADKYLFSDAVNFFKKFNKKDLYIVSYGMKGYQDIKIKHARVQKYFKKVIILDGFKSEGVKEIVGADKIKKDEKFFFMDDKAEWVEDVKKRYPRVITFLVKRREGRYNDKKNRHCDFEVKNLKEAAKLIEKLEKSNKSEEGLCAE